MTKQKNLSLNLDSLKQKQIRQLIHHMGQSEREPFEKIIVDGAQHECQMFVHGKT